MQGLILFVVCAAVAAWLLFRKRAPVNIDANAPANLKEVLLEYVVFYQQLNEEKKLLFENKVKEFLSYVRIHAVNTEVSDVDRILVAASATIPIFGFPQWRYHNLDDVLVYDDAFNAEDFKTTGEGRNVLGMVGSGTMNRMMILSRNALEQGYMNKTGKENTAIHEFVHLLDKADGATDGIPEALLDKKEIVPWLRLMHQSIQEIMKNKSDINPYGATNEAEFFAVASEYFFERPDLFEKKHPELYTLMEEIFHQDPLKH